MAAPDRAGPPRRVEADLVTAPAGMMGMRARFEKLAPIAFLGVLPIAPLVIGALFLALIAVAAFRRDLLSADADHQPVLKHREQPVDRASSPRTDAQAA